MERKYVFPFAAVLGQEKLKQALVLNVINPAIGGVLITGEKGTAKSTLVRGLAVALRDMQVVEVPLNVSEDRLIGTLDLEKAVRDGVKTFEPGILKMADGNLLYIDEVNLLSDYIVNCLLEVAASHQNRVEREGISYTHQASFALVGTMNPEEGELRPQFLDRFGLQVGASGSQDLRERVEIIRRRLEYEKDPVAYVQHWQSETGKLAIEIEQARQLLPLVKVSEPALKLAAEISKEANCAGHRAEIVIVETAKAIAALAGRKNVTLGDIKQAAALALPHRARQVAPPTAYAPPPPEGESSPGPDQDTPPETPNQPPPEKESTSEPQNTPAPEKQNKAEEQEKQEPEQQEPEQAPGLAGEEDIAEPDDIFKIKPLKIEPGDRKRRKGSGRRSRTVTSSLQGRYIRYSIPRGKIKDIALAATIRVAAPFQKYRSHHGMAISIKDFDLREKIREKRTGSTILFVVDASGSMGVRKRMKAVKGAIVSLLNDAYQKRDKVGLVVFRKDKAELLLGITRSVDLAQKSLKELPTGGKTPLASGLYRGYEVLKAARLKDPEIIPLLVLVSDGRANVAMNGLNPVDEALAVAQKIAAEGIKALVIDTERDFIKLGLAAKIAAALKADYCKLEDLKEAELEVAVRSFI